MEKLKELDKRILIGTIITIVCLVVWLITLPMVSYKSSPFDPYAGLNESQRYDQTFDDVNNFNRAVLFQNNNFCKEIINTTMKNQCLSTITAPYVDNPVNDIPPPEQETKTRSPEDVSNYNRAVLLDDKSHCNSIIDEEVKTECLGRWQ